MGREIKRVPLDFSWPKDKVWEGYLNPHYSRCSKCETCDGSGYSQHARFLHDQWYGKAEFKPESRGSTPFLPSDVLDMAKRNVEGSPWYYGTGDIAIMQECKRLCEHFNKAWSHHLNEADIQALIDANRLWDFTHDWTQEGGWKRKNPVPIPTPSQVNKWSIRGFGHDCLNAGIVIRAECERTGEQVECGICNGDGTIWPSQSAKEDYEKWNRTEPPTGEGYQLWETVSEGSPISPAFEKPEDLAHWLCNSEDYTWRENDRGTTFDQWMKFIVGDGWAMSGVFDGKEFKTGVQHFADHATP